jgi:hypothetical protein
MSEQKQHIYHSRIETIRQAILEACTEHDVTREQLLADLLLIEEVEEHDLERQHKQLD